MRRAHEQGLADFEVPTWFAVFLSRGASERIIRKLNQAAFATAHTPSVQERLNVLAAPADSSVAGRCCRKSRRLSSPKNLTKFVFSCPCCVGRASGAEKFPPPPKRYFFDSIGPQDSPLGPDGRAAYME
jgi:hypothetical protein